MLKMDENRLLWHWQQDWDSATQYVSETITYGALFWYSCPVVIYDNRLWTLVNDLDTILPHKPPGSDAAWQCVGRTNGMTKSEIMLLLKNYVTIEELKNALELTNYTSTTLVINNNSRFINLAIDPDIFEFIPSKFTVTNDYAMYGNYPTNIEIYSLVKADIYITLFNKPNPNAKSGGSYSVFDINGTELGKFKFPVHDGTPQSYIYKDSILKFEYIETGIKCPNFNAKNSISSSPTYLTLKNK